MQEENEYTGRDIGYWRVSTQDQDPQLQTDALRKAGIPDNMMFGDKASGVKARRPGLARAMKVASRGDCIVIWKLDRLGRSLTDTLDTIKALSKRKVNVRSLTEPFDTTTPWGVALMQISLVFAEMERNLIAERTRAGMQSKRERDPTWKPGKPHYIADRPKKLAKFKELWLSGELQDMTGKEIVAELNKADPRGPQIKAVQVYFNWKRGGFVGFDIPDGDDDGQP